MKGLRMFYVYMILNLINGKMYIGRTTRLLTDRWEEHIQVAYRSKEASTYKAQHKLIHRAIKKYGVHNFEFRIIQELSSFEGMCEAEKYWVAFYKTNACRYDKEFGYNLTDGGE